MFETGEIFPDSKIGSPDVGPPDPPKGQPPGTRGHGKAPNVDLESLVHRIETLEAKVAHLIKYTYC